MKRPALIFILLAAAGAFLVGLSTSCNPLAKRGRATAVPLGQPAPETVGQDEDGHTFHLSDYRGKVVLLDFWMST